MHEQGEREPGAAAARRRRLFFALWPDESVRSRIAECLDAWLPRRDGRVLGPEHWHVTLVFLGSVEERDLGAVGSAGSCVSAPPFEICFDRVEHFGKARVACLAASRTPDAALRLVRGLEQALTAQGVGIAFDERPYRPHVTLARKVAKARRRAAIPALVWPATAFALVESTSMPAGSRYEPLVCYRLDGPST